MASASDQPTLASGSQSGLIDAAWRQVSAIVRMRAASSERAGAPPERQPPAPPLDAFPGYQVLGEIHRGGQGVVYKALQESTQRHVAIKVLRDGHLLTESDISRFEQEVRILGRLRHANIVRIFDSSAAAGRFYYVMDYIPGLPLDAYVRQALPGMASADDIVRLFVKICDAVNAAHLRGIIHRDLKPGNIRVDGEGEPFVLDFGLSKLADEDRSDATLSGQFVGSVPWAAPEQAQARADAIDVRTDVYSLGVLLYQMLTSQFPYAMDGNLPELLSQIVNAAPTPPRTYVANLPIDLETIILKCLQKAPDRRYQSAGDLSRDLTRYLNREPIEARRDSFTYVLTKQLARYKLAAGGAAAFLIVLIGGLAASLTFWKQAETARTAAETERNNAQAQARVAQAANSFLNDMLAHANRGEEGGNANVRVRDVLDEAARLLAVGGAGNEPEVREALLETVATTYRALGLYDEAERYARDGLQSRRERLGDEHPDVASSLLHLAAVLRDRGAYAESQSLAEEALALRRRLLGEDHPLVGAALYELAETRFESHDLVQAEASFRRALELWAVRPPADPELLPAGKTALALVLQTKGDYDSAERLYREALALFQQLHGPEHPDVAAVLNNLASVLDLKGDADGAEENYRAALAMRIKLFGDEHPLVALTINNLAGFLNYTRRDHVAAERLYRDALALRRKALGPDHRDTITSIGNLAGALHDQGRLDEARQLYEEAIAAQRRVFGDHDPHLAAQLGNLATLHLGRGELDAAEPLFREAVAIWRTQGDPQHPGLALQLANLGTVHMRKSEFAAAEACFREALAIRRALCPAEHPEVAQALSSLGVTLLLRGAHNESEPPLREALRQMRAQRGSDHPVTLNGMGYLGLTLSELAWSRRAEPPVAAALAAEAEALLRECLALRTQKSASDSLLALSKSLLGGAIVAAEAVRRGSPETAGSAGDPRARLLEAEGLLQEGFTGMHATLARAATPSSRLSVALAAERLARLYEVWESVEPGVGKAAEAAAWRVRVNEFRAATQPAGR